MLAIINIITLTFYISKNPKGKKKEPKELIINRLRFDSTQIAKYEELISFHRSSIISIDKSINATKKILYQSLTQPENKKISDSLLQEIAKKQLKIEQIHYNHLLDIKKICNKHQMQDFDNLTDEFSRIFLKLPNRNGPKKN